MDHQHPHGGHHHDHRHHHHHDTANMSDARLIWAIGVNMLLTVAQVVGGIVAGSLSLVADALHNLNDAASIAIALIARRVARKPPDKKRTYGYRRAELIGALINLTTLIIVGVYLICEAVGRFFEQQQIDGWIVVMIAGVAVIVDIATAVLTYSMSKGNLNVRAAFVHNVSDALASVGVLVAGTLIILFEWYWADLVATVVISAYILWQGFFMMRSTIRVLMDSVPAEIEFDSVVAEMEAIDGVQSVHHVHIRSMDEHRRALEAHVVVNQVDESIEQLKQWLRDMLRRKFEIVHTTLEIEPVDSHEHSREIIPRA